MKIIKLVLLCAAVFLMGYNFGRYRIAAVAPAPVTAELVDHEDVFTEVSTTDYSKTSEAMMWALRSDAKYKWVELRPNPFVKDSMLVVRHTTPKPVKKIDPGAGVSELSPVVTFGVNGGTILLSK